MNSLHTRRIRDCRSSYQKYCNRKQAMTGKGHCLFLMKVDYSKTKLVTIIAYALSVVALGMVGSLLANIWKGDIGFGIAAVLLLVAVVIGKKK